MKQSNSINSLLLKLLGTTWILLKTFTEHGCCKWKRKLKRDSFVDWVYPTSVVEIIFRSFCFYYLSSSRTETLPNYILKDWWMHHILLVVLLKNSESVDFISFFGFLWLAAETNESAELCLLKKVFLSNNYLLKLK